jgi:hypothetical protein
MTSLLDRPTTRNPRGKPAAPPSPARAVTSLADLIKPALGLADTDPVEWLYQQIQYHEHSRDGLSEICSVGLADLWCALRGQPAVTVADLTREPGRLYPGLELLTLDFPRSERHTALAEQLDEQAESYTRMGSPVCRLAARVALWYSEGVDYHTAHTAAQYWATEEAWEEQSRKPVLNRYTHQPIEADPSDYPF